MADDNSDPDTNDPDYVPDVEPNSESDDEAEVFPQLDAVVKSVGSGKFTIFVRFAHYVLSRIDASR